MRKTTKDTLIGFIFFGIFSGVLASYTRDALDKYDEIKFGNILNLMSENAEIPIWFLLVIVLMLIALTCFIVVLRRNNHLEILLLKTELEQKHMTPEEIKEKLEEKEKCFEIAKKIALTLHDTKNYVHASEIIRNVAECYDYKIPETQKVFADLVHKTIIKRNIDKNFVLVPKYSTKMQYIYQAEQIV